MTDITRYNETIFESIKHINEYGQEFWYARELQKVLEYTEWRNFSNVIDKAKEDLPTPEKSIQQIEKEQKKKQLPPKDEN